MYLRFRQSRTIPAETDGTFEKLYRQLHGRLPEFVTYNDKPKIKIQIYLVKNQRINKKPCQIYIGVLVNAKVYFDENKIVVPEDFWREIKGNFVNYFVPENAQELLIEKIEEYLKELSPL